MKRHTVNIVIVLSVCLGRAACVSDTMEGWLSTSDHHYLLAKLPPIHASGAGSGVHINVNTGSRYQSMKGFGAALTNSAAYVINNSPISDDIINALFSNINGIGISYIRLPMGASDLQAEPPYSYADVPWDYNMDHFTIEKDKKYIIPVLKRILAVNPNLKIMGSPWSPPAWMKTTNQLKGGELRSDSATLAALAKYFLKFIQSYQSEGISIDTVTVQNEPMFSTTGYSTMLIPWERESEFVKHYLGPTFRSNGINTGILIWDHNWDNPDYPNNILKDQETAQYVAGVAWHCYSGDKNVPSQVHDRHPDKDMYFSECSGGTWAPHFDRNLIWFMDTLFISQPRAWTRTVLLWNLALNEHYGPTVDVHGCETCRGVVTVPTYGGFYREVEYYTIGHMSKFVMPGAVRIDSTEGDNIKTVAFQNPDGSVAIVVLNKSTSSENIAIQINNQGQYFTYQMPGHSVVTFLV